MTKKQKRIFDLFIAAGMTRIAVAYAANIILGPELARKILR